jgi:hypothetical protein
LQIDGGRAKVDVTELALDDKDAIAAFQGDGKHVITRD